MNKFPLIRSKYMENSLCLERREFNLKGPVTMSLSEMIAAVQIPINTENY